jgi:dTDP-glucose pyrophosphorylase
MTLVIMAAGLGSRFGGLKQIEPAGPNGELIIDYSIYDAIQAGFKKVVFIIKEENYEIFRDKIGKNIEDKVKVEYAFQSLANIPEGIELPSDRVKPLGTGQALYCAMEYIDGPFAIVSADDFYGREPFHLLYESLSNQGEFSVIGYKIGNTLTESGSVKRGVCFEENGILKSIVESKVERIDGVIVGEPLDGSPKYEMVDDQPVSMLMYGMQTPIIDFLKEDIKKFFKENMDGLAACEYLLPTALSDFQEQNSVPVKLIPTSSVWKGVTYASDLDELREYIRELIDNGEYPKNLY